MLEKATVLTTLFTIVDDVMPRISDDSRRLGAPRSSAQKTGSTT
jgi:hypothetical protein